MIHRSNMPNTLYPKSTENITELASAIAIKSTSTAAAAAVTVRQ